MSKEDQEIDLICKTMMANPPGFVAGIAVDDDAKADRYLKKIQEKHPSIEQESRFGLLGNVMMKIVRRELQ